MKHIIFIGLMIILTVIFPMSNAYSKDGSTMYTTYTVAKIAEEMTDIGKTNII